MKALAWFAIILSIAIVLAIIIFATTGEIDEAMIYLRALIIVPFSLIWGIKQLKRRKYE